MVDVQKLKNAGRKISTAKSGDEDLGPFRLLPGTWKTEDRGWNLIALPFAGGAFKYRLLMNQYRETLKFTVVDKGIPNRGVSGTGGEEDQIIVGLDYLQEVEQIAAGDDPHSGLAGDVGQAIHKEPGLFLHMTNHATDDLDIARLANVPHGDSILALGRYKEHVAGAPQIPKISGLPIGGPTDLSSPYLQPYKEFHDKPFENLFDPTIPNDLLRRANQGQNIVRHTMLDFDSKLLTGGIANIPFIVKQANANEMTSTFWISEIEGPGGEKALQLQYTQTVMLDFFPRTDGGNGLIKWPHISINTLRKTSGPE